MSRRQFAVVVVGAALVARRRVRRAAAPHPPRERRPAAETTDAGAVAVSIKDFAFEPAAIVAKVGQVVTFTNTGFEPHNATLDAGGCATATLDTGQDRRPRLQAAGVYPFHCTVHAQMTGTITVGG